jgi:hypothetical protein
MYINFRDGFCGMKDLRQKEENLEDNVKIFYTEDKQSEALNTFFYSKFRIKQLLSFDSVNVWIWAQ